MNYQELLHNKLRTQFGYHDYKNQLQKEATEAVYRNKKNIFICMPSGFGKSLCFQLPILLKDNSFVIVISPTIASTQNQVQYLNSKQILVYNLDAYTPGIIKDKIKAEMKSKNPKMKLLYITPEQFISTSFQTIVQNIQPNILSYFVIDEVHCLSPWSHDYRHSYQKIFEWPIEKPIVAITASATKKVKEDIFKILKLQDSLIFSMPIFRSNLFHDVWFVDNLLDPVKHLKDFIEEKLGSIDLSVPKEKRNSGIILCQRRDTVLNLAKVLNSMGITAKAYDTRFNIKKRHKIQYLWNCGEFSVIVATNNFGIGISKQTVRFVVHWYILSSIGNYYQESGRAGHDGSMSYCRIYCYLKNISSFNQYLVNEKGFVPGYKNQQIYSRNQIISRIEMINSIIKLECKHVIISKYFGNEVPVCKRHCDVCENKKAVKEKILQLSYFHENNFIFNNSSDSYNCVVYENLNIYTNIPEYEKNYADNQIDILLKNLYELESNIYNIIREKGSVNDQKVNRFNEPQKNKAVDSKKSKLYLEIRASADLQLQEIYKILHRKNIVNMSGSITSVVNSNLCSEYESYNVTSDNRKKLKTIESIGENRKLCGIQSCSHLHCQMKPEEQLKLIQNMLYNN